MSICIKNAFKEYNGKTVLEVEELNFDIGHVYVLMGLNGSGKSTLLNCASGLERFSSGEVFFNGESSVEAFRKNIAVMLQKPYMFSGTVYENIKLGLGLRKFSKEEVYWKLAQYYKYLNMEFLLDKNAKKLSGGEQAKVALLRTAVLEAEFTFLDEPTASMDIESTLEAESLIRSMAAGKRTVVLVTHDLYQADRLADYIIFLDKGKIIEKGDKYQVFNAPKHKLVKQIMRRGEEYDKKLEID
jgi:tungstate transport system ATP-binding protein